MRGFKQFCENYNKSVVTDVDLKKALTHLGEFLVPFKINKFNPSTGQYEIVQDTVMPLDNGANPKKADNHLYQNILELIKVFWDRGYALGDFAPENLAYQNGKLKVLDLDSFQDISDSGFDSVEELLNIATKWFGRKDMR